MRTEGTKISIENKNGITELHGKIKEVTNKKDIEVTENYLILASELKESPTGEFSFNCGETVDSIVSTGKFVEIPDDQYQVATVIYDADGKGEFMIYDSTVGNAVKTSYIVKTVDNKKTTGKYININSVTPHDGYTAVKWSDGASLLRRDTYKTLASNHKDLHLKLIYDELKKVSVYGGSMFITRINDKVKENQSDNIDYTTTVTKGNDIADLITVYFVDGLQTISMSILYEGATEAQTFTISSESAVYDVLDARGDSVGFVRVVSDPNSTESVTFGIEHVSENLEISFSVL